MLIKVTNTCSEGCWHCMEDSRPNTNQHMTEDTFRKAMSLTQRVEKKIPPGVPMMLAFSGGECSEHPEIVSFMRLAESKGFMVTMITNGRWLSNETMKKEILGREWAGGLLIQVTHDPKFYRPEPPPFVKDPRITYIDSLTKLLPLGRLVASKRNRPLPNSKAPASFNLRSLTRTMGSIEEAVGYLRGRLMVGKGTLCSPSVSFDGTVHAGDSTNCFQIGTVDSTNLELTQALIKMRCNACGLVDNLTLEQKNAIGEI